MTDDNVEVIEEEIAVETEEAEDDMATLLAEAEADHDALNGGDDVDEEIEAAPIIEAEGEDDGGELDEAAGEEGGTEEVIKATTQEENERSKTIPRERFDKVNDGKKAAEAALEAANAELAEYKSVLREQLDKKEDVAEVDDFDPLDPEADAKYTKEMQNLRDEVKGNNFINAVKAENAAFGAANPEEWKAKQDSVLADIAIGHLNEAADLGQQLSEAKAFEIAQQELATKMYKIHESGKSMGDYMNKQANRVAAKYAKPQSEKKPARQKGVDVVELENLRNSAGASTNKTIGSRIKGGDSMAALQAEADAEWKQQSMQ